METKHPQWHSNVKTDFPRLAEHSVDKVVTMLNHDEIARGHAMLELEHRAAENDAEAQAALRRLCKIFGHEPAPYVCRADFGQADIDYSGPSAEVK